MKSHKIINALFFQIIWFACIYGASQGILWVAGLLVIGFIAWELWHTDNRLGLTQTVATVTLLGCIVDTLLLQSGLVVYQAAFDFIPIAPLWILCLWAAFSLTLNQSMQWLQNHTLLSLMLGAILGPFTYWVADVYWDAVSLQGDHLLQNNTLLPLSAIGVLWSIATPLSLKVAKYKQQHTMKKSSLSTL